MIEMTIEEVHIVLLEMLKHIHKFCEENSINYSLSGGTLLGAIRHNGFIPWDNDADIQMLRPDFDKFVNCYSSNEKYKLAYRELSNGKDVLTNVAIIFENKNTFLDQGAAVRDVASNGIWIDIIPVDGAPSDLKTAKKFIKLRQVGYYIIRCLQARYATMKCIKRYDNFKTKVSFLFGKCLGYIIPMRFVDYYVKFCKKYNIECSDYIIASDHYGIREWQPKSIMNKFIKHKFENTELYIMENYDYNLKRLYGNYMEYPPIEKRNNHGTIKCYWKKK